MQDVASCQYKVMQLDSRRAVDMLYVNGRLIHHVRNEMGDHSYGVGSALHTYMCVCVCTRVCVFGGVCMNYMCVLHVFWCQCVLACVSVCGYLCYMCVSVYGLCVYECHCIM